MSLIPPPPSLPAVPPIPVLTSVENLVFKQRRIELDGYRFKNCAFVDCTFVVRKGNFSLEECFFQGSWFVFFEGNARRVMRFDSLLDPASTPPDYKAVVHPNGGVTIK